MLTPDGAQWLAAWIVERLLAGGSIVVSDGGAQSQSSLITKAEVDEEEGSHFVVAEANFASEVANFDWALRSVELADGTVIDTDDTDAGRKVAGQVWDYEVRLKVVAVGS